MALITLNDGFYELFYDVLVKQKLGHVQVQHPAFGKTRAMHDTLKDGDLLIGAIEKLPETEAVTGRLHGTVLASAGEKSSGATVVGIEPAREDKVTNGSAQVIEGSYLQGPGKDALVGTELADELGVGVGGEVFLFTQAADGSMAYDIYSVAGIYRTGSVILDKGLQVHISSLQELLVLDGQMHELVVLSSDSTEPGVEGYLDSVSSALGALPKIEVVRPGDEGEEGENDVLLRTWWETSPQSYELIQFRDVGTFIFLGIVFFIAGFGILNTMLMSVFERTRELGVLKALGLRPNRMVLLVIIESVFLSGLAAGLGILFGSGLNFLLVEYGIDISGGTGEPMEMMGALIEPQVKGVVIPSAAATPVVALFVISVLASIWPAWRASRLEPVAAIRQE